MRINVFRRPRTFPAAPPFGPWREERADPHKYSHDYIRDDMDEQQVTTIMAECYGYIEDELAEKYGVDTTVEPEYKGRGKDF